MQKFYSFCINIHNICIDIQKLFISLWREKYNYVLDEGNRITKTSVTMGKWQNFYLQKMGVDGEQHPYPVLESVSTWGIFCKEIPFKLSEKVKEPAKRSWYDEHGDDEYMSPNGLYMESYTMEVELGCKLIGGSRDTATYGTSVSDVREKVGLFLRYLRESGMLNIYSSYTRIGRRYVRLDSVKDDAKWKSDNGEEWLIFKVVLKVNDPVFDIELSVSNATQENNQDNG